MWPVIQQVQELPLKTMTLQIESAKVYTSQGVPITVTGIAQVKIQGAFYIYQTQEIHIDLI